MISTILNVIDYLLSEDLVAIVGIIIVVANLYEGFRKKSIEALDNEKESTSYRVEEPLVSDFLNEVVVTETLTATTIDTEQKSTKKNNRYNQHQANKHPNQMNQLETNKLREAIILSEIVGKPLSKRRHQRGRQL